MGEIDTRLNSDGVSVEDKAVLKKMAEVTKTCFGSAKKTSMKIIEVRKRLSKKLKDRYCIIGATATSTTDEGVNPFDSKYANMGTHATVINTILNGGFLDDSPEWYSILITLVVSFLVFFVIRNLEPLKSIVSGFVILFILLTGLGMFFMVSGIYINYITPFLSVFFTFIILTIVKFLVTAKEKTFIRHAFGHYLSTEVINEIISDPGKLRLGGEKKYITAFFTDVKGFSTISEKLDPGDLVLLLNEYLTAMSDIILDLNGTIDKYEGDAIISFFGAPVEFDNHAERACLAAVRMKKVELEINKKFIEKGMSPSELLTRIGINTGDMVVGNMGTANNFNYTMMGSAVNLAARLEGVNKQYGTWTLISEAVYKAGGKNFTARKMDRVRVVGIKTPVRIYELIDEKNVTPKKILEGVATFHRALEFFEKREWGKAYEEFDRVNKYIPGDPPSAVFKKRCAKFKKASPPDNWDGVFILDMK